jgi:hypothetical protein
MARGKIGKSVNWALSPGRGIACPSFPPDILDGISDEAAIFSLSPDSDLAQVTAHLLGRWIFAVNLHELGHMGVKPRSNQGI